MALGTDFHGGRLEVVGHDCDTVVDELLPVGLVEHASGVRGMELSKIRVGPGATSATVIGKRSHFAMA